MSDQLKHDVKRAKTFAAAMKATRQHYRIAYGIVSSSEGYPEAMKIKYARYRDVAEECATLATKIFTLLNRLP